MATSPEPEEVECPFCAGPVWSDDGVCPHCDAPLVPGVCLHCREVNPTSALRCGKCGSPNLRRSPTAARPPRADGSARSWRIFAVLALSAGLAAGGYLAWRRPVDTASRRTTSPSSDPPPARPQPAPTPAPQLDSMNVREDEVDLFFVPSVPRFTAAWRKDPPELHLLLDAANALHTGISDGFGKHLKRVRWEAVASEPRPRMRVILEVYDTAGLTYRTQPFKAGPAAWLRVEVMPQGRVTEVFKLTYPSDRDLPEVRVWTEGIVEARASFSPPADRDITFGLARHGKPVMIDTNRGPTIFVHGSMPPGLYKVTLSEPPRGSSRLGDLLVTITVTHP